MATPIFRTAHSAVVRDAMDFSAALCGPSGETVAQAVTIPLQLGSIPNAMRTLLARHGDRLRAGRRLPRQRPVRRREPHARHLRRQAVVRRRTLIGFAVIGRAPRRHRRPRARHHRVRQHRGLPGGPAPAVAAGSYDRGRAGTRRCSRSSARTSACRTSCSATSPRRSRRATSATARCRSSPRGTARSARDADGRPARPHRARCSAARSRAGPTGSRTFTDYIGSDGIDVRDVGIDRRL